LFESTQASKKLLLANIKGIIIKFIICIDASILWILKKTQENADESPTPSKNITAYTHEQAKRSER
jgi:flagellar basal body-associated protein FliL